MNIEKALKEYFEIRNKVTKLLGVGSYYPIHDMLDKKYRDYGTHLSWEENGDEYSVDLVRDTRIEKENVLVVLVNEGMGDGDLWYVFNKEYEIPL
jgi:hypothetical protein